MSSTNVGIEDARAQLGDLATRAQQGYTTILTRNGKPVAKIAPLAPEDTAEKRLPSAIASSTVPGQKGRLYEFDVVGDSSAIVNALNGTGVAVYTGAQGANVQSWSRDAILAAYERLTADEFQIA